MTETLPVLPMWLSDVIVVAITVAVVGVVVFFAYAVCRVVVVWAARRYVDAHVSMTDQEVAASAAPLTSAFGTRVTR